MKKKPFKPPFGSRLVLPTDEALVEIEFVGEDSSITIKPTEPGRTLNMVDFQAEALAKTLLDAAKLVRGEGV